MDLVAACRVLVEVDARGSVTGAAGALGVAQSVASRRIAGLERHLGAPLLERSARRAVLTPFGHDVVPAARRLVHLADDLVVSAERARLRPVAVAVPDTCGTRDLAVVEAAARAAGLHLEFRPTDPRAPVPTGDPGVRVAVVAVPPERARWVAPLGVGGRRAADGPLRLGTLRARRGAGPGPRLRLTPQDDVAHVRDVLVRTAHAEGLTPGQVPVDDSVVAALARVLAGDDLMVCTAAEADDLGLGWRPFAGVDLARGFTLSGDSEQDVRSVLDAVGEELAAALGASSAAAPRTADGRA